MNSPFDSAKPVRLFYLINPSHTINALSILKSDPDEKFENLFLIHWPGASDSMAAELFEVFKTLLAPIVGEERLVFFPQSLKDRVQSTNSVRDLRKRLKRELRNQNVEQIFYAHDVEGGMYNLLCLGFPFARRICFGDAFGLVFERDVHLGMLVGRPTSKAKRDRTLRRWQMMLGLGYNAEILPTLLFRHDEARLILPVDQSGRFLKMRPFTVIPKEHFKLAIAECIDSAKDLTRYIQELSTSLNGRRCSMLVTDNFAEGKFIDFDLEIEMYADMIKSYCNPGDIILLKSHPGENLPRNEEIIQKLGATYTVIAFDSRFKRFPLELWREILARCEVVLCLSYPTLSLKYLYDIDVVNPMTNSFIEKWFKPWTWESYRDSRDLYFKPLKNLATWDHKSALYVGNNT